MSPWLLGGGANIVVIETGLHSVWLNMHTYYRNVLCIQKSRDCWSVFTWERFLSQSNVALFTLLSILQDRYSVMSRASQQCLPHANRWWKCMRMHWSGGFAGGVHDEYWGTCMGMYSTHNQSRAFIRLTFGPSCSLSWGRFLGSILPLTCWDKNKWNWSWMCLL